MNNIIEGAKGIVALLRDGLITFILALLLISPDWVNQRLNNAGFVSGNIGGFQWQSKLKASTDNLKDANTTINSLKDQLRQTQDALTTSEKLRQQLADEIKATAPDSQAAKTAAAAPPNAAPQITVKNDQVLRSAVAHSMVFQQQIRANDQLLATVPPPQRQ